MIRCVPNKNHVARLKVKITVRSYTLCIGFNETCLCPANNFVMRGGILKKISTNNHHDKMMCRK